MAEPLSIAAGIVGLVTFALQASVVLHTTVRGLQNQDKHARALKSDVSDLNQVLDTLLDTVSRHPEINFDDLRKPLSRCGKTCQEYAALIAECTKHAHGTRPSVRDWFKQQYMRGDFDEFKSMLAVYKSTISISLANANLRITAITPGLVVEYKELIQDTTNELQEHLQSLNDRVEAINQSLASAAPAAPPTQGDNELRELLDEKESTQQSLRMCMELSARIQLWETTSRETPGFAHSPSSYKHTKTALGDTKSSIDQLIFRLQKHEEDIDRQLTTRSSSGTAASSISLAEELERLQETKESLCQCKKIISEARDSLTSDRRNVFEDINLDDRSYAITVSTVGDLVTARQIVLKKQSRYVGGQIDVQGYQATIENLTQLDRESSMSSSRREADGAAQLSGVNPRYGRGFTLAETSAGEGLERSRGTF